MLKICDQTHIAEDQNLNDLCKICTGVIPVDGFVPFADVVRHDGFGDPEILLSRFDEYGIGLRWKGTTYIPLEVLVHKDDVPELVKRLRSIPSAQVRSLA